MAVGSRDAGRVASWAALGLTALLGACSPAATPQAGPLATAEAFRTTPPPPGPAPVVRAPVVERRDLASGLSLFVVPQTGLPLLRVEVVVRGGTAADPPELPGLAAFLAETLRAGTTTRSAERIAEEVETLGSDLSIDVGPETMTLGFTSLSGFAPAVFAVLADVLLHPAFAPAEIERVRRQQLGALAQAKDDPERVARRVITRGLYGAHPYGHTALGNEASLVRIQRKELEALHAASVRPTNAAVIVVGDIEVAAAEKLVGDLLGAWPTVGGALPRPPDPNDPAPGLLLVDRANAPQSEVRIGHLGIARDHPDYLPLVILNEVLGGTFNSRINLNLREDKGYTYGAHSAFDTRRARGSFVVASAVRTDATALAIREVLEEIEAIRAANVTADELRLAKNGYALALPGLFQDVEAVAAMVAELFEHDLPLDYFQRLPAQVEAITIADLRRVAAAHLHPERLVAVVVGDRAQIEESLRRLPLGPLRQVDADGVGLP